MSAVFTDATSGVTTYGACRTVEIPKPDEDGTVVLDFNRALNLPCAFNNMPVCPVALEEIGCRSPSKQARRSTLSSP